ncbi:PH domain-containing protein [Streptomyces sp. NPDC007083]|uniref:PH domain-containing protein n=1 Tax=Streptomyces sp. NPDC007083 TaxID=3156913 RepID=UPI0033D79535
MTETWEVPCSAPWRRALWLSAGLGTAVTVLEAARATHQGTPPNPWSGIGPLVTLISFAMLHAVSHRVTADADGVHLRSLLRRRHIPWSDISDLRVRRMHTDNWRVPETHRIMVVLRGRRKRLLPLPVCRSAAELPDFEAKLAALRALHRRHAPASAPRTDRVPVISARTAGRSWAGSLALCVLLLAGAGTALAFVPAAETNKRAWEAAAPCTAATPTAERGECLTTLRAEIERTDANRPKQRSWLYFTEGRPLERLGVSREAALDFEAGDRVELTVWRREVREVSGAGHLWREHFPGAGDVVMVAAACLLAAGLPGARILMRLRGRRLPEDEVLPSALPFAGALAGTAGWLLPLCYLHPLDFLASPAVTAWTAGGSVASAGLFAWAWYASRIRRPDTRTGAGTGTGAESGTGTAPGTAAVTGTSGTTGARGTTARGDVFLAARFLEHTDYNPNGFGSHVVLGDGPPAVAPHRGPGRFAVKPLPVERLTVRTVRRPRGGDGEAVPRKWHIAELDDAGTPVRLAAAPADLARIVAELRRRPGAPAESGV